MTAGVNNRPATGAPEALPPRLHDLLIMIPTYNERDNVENIAAQLLALGLKADILFVDDNSPDGTGQTLDALAAKHPNLFVMHRPGKLGIGTAHLDGIDRAYRQGYATLITMDCDFTHSPSDVLRLLDAHPGNDITVGSRYLEQNSLPGWNLLRKSLTMLGHFLTVRLLKMRYDATGAFRIYDLHRIPRGVFDIVESKGYSFFFESLFVLHANGFKINEVAISLPARTYGHSKMSLREAGRSLKHVLTLCAASTLYPNQFRMIEPLAGLDPTLVDPQGWDAYWERKRRVSNILYEIVATIYRTLVVKRRLNQVILHTFAPGSRLLHAGCGAGQVDENLQRTMKITAVDISVAALQQYRKNNPLASSVRHGDILSLSVPPASFDGIYNLGVMEHFTRSQILRILAQFHRALRPGGKLVLFWPHQNATSVGVLRFAHWLLNDVWDKHVQLHPAEVSLLRSPRHVEDLLREAGFRMTRFNFGPQDLFVQAVVVAEKAAPAEASGSAPLAESLQAEIVRRERQAVMMTIDDLRRADAHPRPGNGQATHAPPQPSSSST